MKERERKKYQRIGNHILGGNVEIRKKIGRKMERKGGTYEQLVNGIMLILR